MSCSLLAATKVRDTTSVGAILRGGNGNWKSCLKSRDLTKKDFTKMNTKLPSSFSLLLHDQAYSEAARLLPFQHLCQASHLESSVGRCAPGHLLSLPPFATPGAPSVLYPLALSNLNDIISKLRLLLELFFFLTFQH